MTEKTLQERILKGFFRMHTSTVGDVPLTENKSLSHLPPETFQPRLTYSVGQLNNINFTYSVYPRFGPTLAARLGESLEKAGVLYGKKEEWQLVGADNVQSVTYVGSLPIAPETLLLLDRVRLDVIEQEAGRVLSTAFARMKGLLSPGGEEPEKAAVRAVRNLYGPAK